MNAKQNSVESVSKIEEQLASIQMLRYERDAVLYDARTAELIVGAIVWACSKFERPSTVVFAKPSPKY